MYYFMQKNWTMPILQGQNCVASLHVHHHNWASVFLLSTTMLQYICLYLNNNAAKDVFFTFLFCQGDLNIEWQRSQKTKGQS